MSDEFLLKHIGMKHNGGTKDYDILILVNQTTNHALLVRRWGKVGAAGQTKTKQFRHFRQAERWAGKLIEDKTTPEHGYVATESSTHLDVGEVMNLDFIGCSVSLNLKFIATSEDMEFLTGQPGVVNPFQSTAPAHTPAPEDIKKVVPKVAPSHYGSW